MPVDKRKQSIYLPEKILEELQAHANRLDRSMSWLLQTAWNIAREKIESIPETPVVR